MGVINEGVMRATPNSTVERGEVVHKSKSSCSCTFFLWYQSSHKIEFQS